MARHFTKEEIDEIRRQLSTYGVRDSEFPEAATVSSEDEVMILQDEKNKRLDVGKIENKIYTKIHDEGIGGKVLSDNNYTTPEKNKLAGIASSAQVNVIEKIKQDGVLRPIASDKSVNIDLSDFVHKNLVPPEATPSNKLADKKYVHDEIVVSAATFRGTSPKNLTEEQFIAWANTREHDLNDYVYWDTIDANEIPIYKRYKWDNHEWVFEYVVNNSDFSDAQLAAINSGIDTTHVDKLDALPTRSGLTEEFAEKQDVIEDLDEIRQNAETGGNAYHLPETGIPSTDLSEGVNSSLAKAESAIQDVSDKISSEDIDDVIELTQEEFDALETKDPRTLYIVSDSTIESDHVGIASLVQTTVATTDEGINVWTCTLTNNQTFTLQVKNGSKGTSGYSGAAEDLEVVNSLDSTDDTAALAASQGKVLNDSLTQLGQEVDFNFSEDAAKAIPMSLGYIVCNGAAGTVVNLTPVAHTTYKYAVFPCSAGDVLYIQGKGGNSDRLYCFIDAEDKVISSAYAYQEWSTPYKYIAPANTAKVIINDETGQRTSFYGEPEHKKIDQIPIVARCLDMQYDGDRTVTMDIIYLYTYKEGLKTLYCNGDASSHSPKAFLFGETTTGALLVIDSSYNIVWRLNNSSLQVDDIVLLSYSNTLKFDGGGVLYSTLSKFINEIKVNNVQTNVDNVQTNVDKAYSLFSDKVYDLEVGGINSADGSEISYAAGRTGFVKILRNCDLYVSAIGYGTGTNRPTILALYDSNKQFIQSEPSNVSRAYYTAKQLSDLGAAYFRCTIANSTIINGTACIAHGSYNNLYFQARCLDLVINSQNSVTIDIVFLYSKAGMTTAYADGDDSLHSPKTFTFGYPAGALLVVDSEGKIVQRLHNYDLLNGDIVLLSHNTTVGFDGGLLYGEYLRVKLSETPTVNVDDSQVFQSAKKIADSYGNGLTPLSIDCDASGYELPTTRQERDIQKKIEQLTSIKWTPLDDMPNIDGSGSFAPGVENTGMPYSSVKERDKFVGFDVSLHTFMTAVNNPYSLLYTENVSAAHSASAWGKTYHGVNCGTYYGVVCNVFATQCCGFKVIWNTQQHDWQSNYLFNLIRVFNQSAQGLKIGDIVWRSGHDQIVYSIKRNSDGDVIGVILAESNGLAHISPEITAQAFDNLLVTHIVYRGMELYKNKYVPSPFVAIRDEVITPFVYNDDICCFAGDKACFRDGETLAINYNLKQVGAWTAMELYKNGLLLETISIDSSGHVLDLTSRNLSYGRYKARLTDGTNYSDYTEFEILQTTVSKEAQGDRTKITFSSSNGTPVYFRICDIAGNNKGTHEFTEKELNDGYCSIDLAKLNAEQYPSSPISGNTYIKVFFQGEFGRVTNEPLQFNP